MVSAATNGKRGDLDPDIQSLTYDYAQALMRIAKKNGFHSDTVQEISKDLALVIDTGLSKKQIAQRDRFLKSILMRFNKALDPPVPHELEKSILKKDQAARLPWEEEVIEKAAAWRKNLLSVKIEIFRRLSSPGKEMNR
jgi:hypothetical protein